MLANIVTDDRLLWLRSSDWSALIIGVALCALTTLLI